MRKPRRWEAFPPTGLAYMTWEETCGSGAKTGIAEDEMAACFGAGRVAPWVCCPRIATATFPALVITTTAFAVCSGIRARLAGFGTCRLGF